MFFTKLKIKKEKGISILFAALILGVVLTIALGVSVILIQQTKMLSEIGYSIIAFFAADTGIEEVLMTYPPTPVSGTLPNGATYEVFITPSSVNPDCPNYCLKSVGTYKKTNRAIEIKY